MRAASFRHGASCELLFETVGEDGVADGARRTPESTAQRQRPVARKLGVVLAERADDVQRTRRGITAAAVDRALADLEAAAGLRGAVARRSQSKGAYEQSSLPPHCRLPSRVPWTTDRMLPARASNAARTGQRQHGPHPSTFQDDGNERRSTLPTPACLAEGRGACEPASRRARRRCAHAAVPFDPGR